jgi:hypothetical protein
VTDEADRKRKLVKEINFLGGRARRVEDRWAAGVLDLIFKLPGYPATWAEGKMIDGNLFGPTRAQYDEGKKWLAAGMPVLLIGWKQTFMFVSPWVQRADIRTCPRGGEQWVAVLQDYLELKEPHEPR